MSICLTKCECGRRNIIQSPQLPSTTPYSPPLHFNEFSMRFVGRMPNISSFGWSFIGKERASKLGNVRPLGWKEEEDGGILSVSRRKKYVHPKMREEVWCDVSGERLP